MPGTFGFASLTQLSLKKCRWEFLLQTGITNTYIASISLNFRHVSFSITFLNKTALTLILHFPTQNQLTIELF